MRWPSLFALCAAAAALISSGVSGLLQAQAPATTPSATTPSKDALVVEGKGLPPRVAAADYAAHAQAGAVAIGADFTGHNVGTQEGILTTDDYVVIEAGVFGPPQARLMLSVDDFSLRINGKKVVPGQPYDLVTKSLKDPEYERPDPDSGSKTILTGTGQKTPGVDPNAPPAALPPIPFEIKRGWQLRVKRDSMPIGDRALPLAGLLFFPYSGGVKGIHSVELIYSGPAGKATLSIHP
jgi:hypothetical protein